METRLQTLNILKDFHKITGARISLHDLDFNEIAAYPDALLPFCRKVQLKSPVKERCLNADAVAFDKVKKTGQPYTYECHCGLVETVAPIYNFGTLTGYFMMGQVANASDNSFDKIKRLSEKHFESTEQFWEYCNLIPKIGDDMMHSYINILEIIAEYMTQTNRLTLKNRDIALGVHEYINKNFSRKITVEMLCDMFGCSRTTLMNSFKSRYDSTVGEYLNELRLKNAKKMLDNSEKSIKAIASECGFSDQNYFAKVFRKKYGETPSDYRVK